MNLKNVDFKNLKYGEKQTLIKSLKKRIRLPIWICL